MNNATIGIIASSIHVSTGSGPVPLTSWQTLTNVTQSTNNLSRAEDEENDAYAVSSGKIPAGTEFIVQFTASTTGDGGKLGVGLTNAVATSIHDFAACLFSNFIGNYGKFIGYGTDYFDDDHFLITTPPLGRVRGDGSLIYFERSFDDGATWNSISSDGTLIDPVTQPAADMWVKALFDLAPSSNLDILSTSLS